MNAKSKGPSKAYASTSLTSEQEERDLRKQRGRKETIAIAPLNEKSTFFDTYVVRTEAGIPYTVEIRSTNQSVNSCSCPDFTVNTLGTCKHIEGVLHQLEKKHKNFKTAKVLDTHIFLCGIEHPQVCISWSDLPVGDSKEFLQPFFSSNDVLISDPLIGLPAIENALSQAPAKIKNAVHISSHLQTWLANEKRKRNHQLSRQQFMADVEAGKHSLDMLSVPLYQYQKEGMLHLAFQGRAMLGDEMGLGKTIQAIGACELLRRLHHIQKVVVIMPASLKGEWEEQIAKFTGLQTLIVQGNRAERLRAYQKPSFFYLLNYEQVRSDFEEIQKILEPDVIILDEAQRIKNWKTKTAWSVKQLKTPYAFVLTGTPIENRIEEIYSILQLVDPYILGPLYKFNQTFFEFNDNKKPIGYKNLDVLHEKLKPVLLRRLKKDVEQQLPERTINNFFVKMDEEQQLRYEEYQARVSKLLAIMKKRALTEDESKKLQQWLACMRMIADTPYILDEQCKICPKLEELKHVLEELLVGTTNKIIIFSEWERMLFLVREHVQNELRLSFAWHTGSVAQEKRREDIKRFKEDPECRLFLTTDSGSTGLNLQAANVVINMDLPWNPAKLEQRIARAWRKHQTRSVQVINFICENSIEERMLTTLSQKQTLSDGVLDGIGDLRKMDLPSARKQMIEQCELQEAEFIEEDAWEDVKSEADQWDDIKNSVVAQFPKRVHSLGYFTHKDSQDKTLLAVVDQCEEGIKSTIVSMASRPLAVKTEVIDQATYELLERLEAAGIITINTDAAKLLYNTSEVDTERQELLSKARKHLNEAERKIRMAELLKTGDFVMEALLPATSALELVLLAHIVWHKVPHKEGDLLLQKMREGVSDKEAYSFMDAIKTYFDELSASLRLQGI